MTVLCHGFFFPIFEFLPVHAYSFFAVIVRTLTIESVRIIGNVIAAGSRFIQVGTEQVTDFCQLFVQDKGHQVGNHIQKYDSVDR